MIRLAKLARIDVILLAFALFLAIELNWQSFTREALAIDEHVSFWIADDSSPSTLLTRSFHYSATPPLSFGLQRLSMTLFGKHEWSLRLPAAVSFLAAIITVWLSSSRFLSPLCGGIGAVILAAHPAASAFAFAGRPYSLGVLLSALALDATARIDETPTTVRCARLTAINLLLIQTHYLFAAVWLAEIVWLARAVLCGRISPSRILLCLVGALISVSSVASGVWHVWEFRIYLDWTTHRPDISDLLALAVPVQPGSFGKPIDWAVAALPVLWQVAAGRYRPIDWFNVDFWKSRRRLMIWCLCGFALPVITLWLLGRYWLPSLAADRYLVIFVPLVAITWAVFCGLVRGTVAPLLCLLALLLWSGAGERAYRAAPLPSGWRAESRVGKSVSAQWKEIADIITNSSSSGSLILVGSGLTEMKLVPLFLDDPVFHDYASCRLGRLYLHGPFRRISLPMFWPQQTIKELDDFYRSEVLKACRLGSASRRELDGPVNSSIWLVAATDTDVLAESARQMRAKLQAAGAREMETWGFVGVIVTRYECP